MDDERSFMLGFCEGESQIAACEHADARVGGGLSGGSTYLDGHASEVRDISELPVGLNGINVCLCLTNISL